MTKVAVVRKAAESVQPERLPAVAAVPALVGFAAFCAVVEWPAWFQTPLFATGSLLASLSMFSIALILWPLTNLRTLAVCCIGAAAMWSMQWFTVWDWSIFPVLGILTNTWFYIVGGTGMLVTPNNVTTRKLARWAIVGLVTISGLQVLMVFFSVPERHGFSASIPWPSLWVGDVQFRIASDLANALCPVVAIAFCFANARHLRVMKSMDRLVALPVVVGFCSVGLIAGFSSAYQMFPPPRQNWFYFCQSLAIFLIPSGFVISYVRQSIRRAYLTDQLSRRLSRQVLTGDVLRDEFRNLLGDETIELFYWSDRDDCYVDTQGLTVAADKLDRAEFILHLTREESRPVAVVTSSATLLDHNKMLDSFLVASAIAIENVQLQANIKSQLEQVRASRARIVEATLEERRRIERDLHDGIQQRLLAIQTRIGSFRKNGIGDASDLLAELSKELNASVLAIREIAHGIHPAELRQFGLKGAVEMLAERYTLTIEVAIEERRYAAGVEAAVYFVTCEALTNIVKHAQATTVRIELKEDCNALELSVADDGIGGTQWKAGGGLEGLSDRLRSVGGELEIQTSVGQGSRVVSTIKLS